MEYLIASILLLKLNLYRIENEQSVLSESQEACRYAELRIDDFEFNHYRFLHQNDDRVYGIWYENLGISISFIEVFNLWRESGSHNQNLLADMDHVCFRTDGLNYVMEGYKK